MKSSPTRVTRRQVLGALIGSGAASGALLRANSQPEAQPPDFSRGMHVVLTGSGAALAVPERGNAGAAVVVDGQVAQFDCGPRTMPNMMRGGINPTTVDYIFLTHLHFDHMGEYGYFIVACWIAGRQKPIRVFGPRGTVAMSDGAVFRAHHTDVTFVSKRVAGEGGPPMKASAQPPVDAKDIGPGLVVETSSFKVTSVETPHIPIVGPQSSLAYRVDSRHGSVVISGDTAPSDAVVELAKGADLLIHECTRPPQGLLSGGSFNRWPEAGKPSTGHTSPIELGQLAERAQVKKVVATHFGLYTKVPAAAAMGVNHFGGKTIGDDVWRPAVMAEIKQGYKGLVVLAEDGLAIKIA